MLSEALDYPREGDDALTTILIGSFLSLLGPLLVPIIPVWGYVVGVLRETSTGERAAAPVFEDWERLFVDGLKAFVVVFVYGLVPAVVAAITVGSAVFAIVFGNQGLQVLGAVSILGGLLVTAVLGLAFGYVIPAGLVAMSRTDSIGAAFSWSGLRPILGNGRYATGWLVALGVWLVASFVVGAINAALPVVGAVPAAVVYFYAMVATAYLYGTAYGDAADVTVEAAESPGTESTA